MKATARRLSRLEAAERDRLGGDPVGDWLALYRAGADVADMNAVAGAAWCEAAAERERLALETMTTYDETFNYIPVGAS